LIKTLLLGVASAVASLFLLIVGLVLFSTPGELNLACAQDTYENHCEGDVAVGCFSGWLTVPKVTRTDCRHSELGEGSCVQKVVSGYHWVGCEVPCDPKTYGSRCSGNSEVYCFESDSRPAFVVSHSCMQTDACAEHTRADGSRLAQCDPRPPEP
jgi:hypothetical protein